jgi:hypothetical protein
MLTPIFRTTLAAAVLAGTALTSNAAEVFNRIATFHVVDNLPEGADPKKSAVAEIITATPDGNRLVYTDSPGERKDWMAGSSPAMTSYGMATPTLAHGPRRASCLRSTPDTWSLTPGPRACLSLSLLRADT